ncbi:PLDc N-terminal domain-containing protein [Agromyces seonyuensis]|uniref:Cardiolipin synthase N-terminal domain-containing protein n=1 Tax=Agromyces seonyuensis TaxID=2662446 RepID=A0A6I4NZV5_9MICO|nr:PLDc N-terminal domain-containing protein [Agromyces seonyuensis]MWB99828.1 hypothetical protein [Agromyces seonyuensis]
MADPVNPLLPAAYDVVWTMLAVAMLVLTAVALVSLARSARALTTTQSLVWVAVVLVAPVLGSIAWLAVGRRTVSAAAASAG